MAQNYEQILNDLEEKIVHGFVEKMVVQSMKKTKNQMNFLKNN